MRLKLWKKIPREYFSADGYYEFYSKHSYKTYSNPYLIVRRIIEYPVCNANK